MKFSLNEIANIVGGKLIGADNIVEFVEFDSRNMLNPKLTIFVALQGKLFDGHSFITSLIESGAKSFLVHENHHCKNKDGVGYVAVNNTLAALQTLAAHYRKQLSMPVIAVAGSNGKSIVKEWIYQLLSDNTIFRSPKSYNSQLGVALSLLMIKGDEELAVIEAGISECGEMTKLERMILPNITIFTNIGEAHGENFCSTEQKLNEKLELIKGCSMVIYNSDNIFVSQHIESRTTKEQQFKWGAEGDIRVIGEQNGNIEFCYKESNYTLSLPFQDRASRENIMHCIAFAATQGCDMNVICRRVELLSSVAMRLEMISGIGGSKIINDSYNSDFNSLSVALSYMRSVAAGGRKIVILSDILQSGRDSVSLYGDVAQLLNGCSIDKVIAIGDKVGDGLKDKYSGEFETYATTESFIDSVRRPDFFDTTILIKGGRKFQFEKISSLLEAKQHSSIMEVNIDAILHNYRYYKSKVKPETKIVAMVKAMSYGSGAYEIALTLQNSGVDYLAVAYIDEGVTLRNQGITLPIITLNSNPGDYQMMIQNLLEPEIYSIYSLNLFIESCRRAAVESYPIHIKLDTGMHRMGFEEEKLTELNNILESTNRVRIASIFSHFSSSDTPSQDSETERQIKYFDSMSSRIMQKGTLRHLCNSAAIIRFPEAHYDMVRLGLGLYGLSDFEQDKLQNVNSLRTRILQIKDIKKGEYVGYNMRGLADRDMRVATLSIGYADGLNRGLSCGKWSMTINGKRAKTVGNISMDTCSVDITNIEAREGDMVEVFSSSEDICEMAKILGTIPYEILTSISTRIKRVYIRE